MVGNFNSERAPNQKIAEYVWIGCLCICQWFSNNVVNVNISSKSFLVILPNSVPRLSNDEFLPLSKESTLTVQQIRGHISSILLYLRTAKRCFTFWKIFYVKSVTERENKIN